MQRGRSLFAGREGDEVADTALALADHGANPDGPASAPFDGEDRPPGARPLIEGGRLLGFLYDVRTARKGRATSANARPRLVPVAAGVGTTNLVVEPGPDDLAELFRQANGGLFVTEVAGLHSGVNPVSGNLSVGASGLLIENGGAGAPARDDHRRRPGGHAPSDPRGGVGGALGALRRQRQGPPILIGEMAVSGS